MDTPKHKIWFPAKSYGYGWGPPTCWQGWVVIAIFFLLTGIGAAVFLPGGLAGCFVVYTAGLSIGLTIVCRLKGEKPRWRWGKEKNGGRDGDN